MAAWFIALNLGNLMSNLNWLNDDQMARLRPCFPKSHGVPRVDDRRVISGFIFINRNGLRWCDAPNEYGPAKTLYNRWKRWSDMGVFARIMEWHAAEAPDNKTISIDATYLKAHRTASSLSVKKGGRRRLIGRSLKDQDMIRGIKYPENGRHEYKFGVRFPT